MYIWSYKCEYVRAHLCIDPAEYHQSNNNLPLQYEPSSPALRRLRSIYVIRSSAYGRNRVSVSRSIALADTRETFKTSYVQYVGMANSYIQVRLSLQQ
jgi:hypothetical protein